MNIARFSEVPLRELWEHEEYDFSKWLYENLDLLSEEIGITLTPVERETAVGSFQIDLLAKDADGGLVVIENQLEATNHDHLGKVLTYFTNIGAKKAVWITKNPRPEHVKAVAWLNEVTPQDISFFLVRVNAYRIGDSEPAPRFTTIAGPSPESKSFGGKKQTLAENEARCARFWEQLLILARNKGVTTHANRRTTKGYWIRSGVGKPGMHLVYVAWPENDSAVELYIDTGDKQTNKTVFDSLFANKEQIEKQFEHPLLWQRLDDRRASRIRYMMKNDGMKDEASWPTVQAEMIDAMDRFSKALNPYIEALPKNTEIDELSSSETAEAF